MRIRLWGLGAVLAIAFAPACGGGTTELLGGVGGGDAGVESGGQGPEQAADAGAQGGSGGSGPVMPTRLPGSACLPAAEFQASFSGFAASDVTVEAGSPYCVESGVCLVDHFEGRVSCPYGQSQTGAGAGGAACSVPGSSERVSVPVEPQRLDRRGEDSVYCSCRCGGPDPGASYCQCDPGFECVERVPEVASGQAAALVGSYCVRTADALPNPVALNAASCELTTRQCGGETGLLGALVPLAPALPPATTTVSPFLEPPGATRKLDLLFMIDNSIGMQAKQELLAQSLGDLLARLANPLCVDAAGNSFPPPAAGAACPTGQQRQSEPITDLHVGFVSSSLGDAGANVACATQGFPNYVPDRVDLGHLIGSLPRGQNNGANAQGFLEWRAGEAGFSQFSANAQRMLRAVGEQGCGWEHSLESWYRFLVDPVPYRSLARVQCRGSASSAANCVQPAVDVDSRILLDDALLAQRAAFLRPDSALAIVMLSDENDCSLQIGNQTWVVVNIDDQRPFFRGSSRCSQDPNDQCCYNCQLGPPQGCAIDPVCVADPANPNRLPLEQDGRNLRCFDQKRRFGVDFLYPTQRYVNALTQRTLCWNALDLSTDECDVADLRPNPLFEGARQPSQIVLAGLVGVPWQPLAAAQNAAGSPLPATQLRFKSSAQLGAQGDATWAQILGSPGVAFRAATTTQPEVASVPRTPPVLPQMVESELPRAGVVAANALNGRDYDTSLPGNTPDDLEFACIFPLAAAQDCSALDPNIDNCACFDGAFAGPLCEQTPGVSAVSTTQYWLGARPGARQLQVLKDLGDSSVVTSICARNTLDASAPDFGYRPALGSLLERLRALDAQ